VVLKLVYQLTKSSFWNRTLLCFRIRGGNKPNGPRLIRLRKIVNTLVREVRHFRWFLQKREPQTELSRTSREEFVRTFPGSIHQSLLRGPAFQECRRKIEALGSIAARLNRSSLIMSKPRFAPRSQKPTSSKLRGP